MFSANDADYRCAYPLPTGSLTMEDVSRVFQLTPVPPEAKNINDYIVAAVQGQWDLPFLFFLHHYEQRLNNRVRRFLTREGLDSYDPTRFLEYKQRAVTAMLSCLHRYDPAKDAAFLTFAHHDIGNAFLALRMVDCAGSFENLTEYKTIRRIAWLYSNPAKTEVEAVAEFSERYGCSKEKAEEHLVVAKRNQQSHVRRDDEQAEKTTEDLAVDDSWDYTSILWGGIRADAVRAAFEKLNYKEQTLVEERCAICMTCGRASPLHTRMSFEDLASLFENGDPSSAERGYRRVLDKLTRLLVEQGTLRAVELKRKSIQRKNKKIAAAVYEYNADCDGDWGEISVDFVHGTAEVLMLAGGDSSRTNRYARAAIREILSWAGNDLPRNWIVAMEP